MTTRFCIVCGCTETTACFPPCAWIADNRCSTCASIAIRSGLTEQQFMALDEAYRHSKTPVIGSVLRRELSGHIHAGRLTVRDEGGTYVWRVTPAGREFLAAYRKAEAAAMLLERGGV